ncbi:GNAT family N-acetyltransferase [Microbulbifer sp. ANSA005]|uniref:GNAT family N-acetyltransferase n=1 Tax=Microbulbifer sp. ANSA005 TaxID=3243362 RepID=UPI004041963F
MTKNIAKKWRGKRMTKKPIVVNSDIKLDPLLDSDTEIIFALIENNRPLLEKYLYWAKLVIDLPTTEKYITDRIFSNSFGASWYKIHYSGKVVGIFGIKEIDLKKQNAEIGYWLCKSCHGNGIVTRIVNRISSYLKDLHDIQALKIQCLSENSASIAVAERVGGVHSETIPNYYSIDGIFQDLKIYTVPT